MHHQIRWIRLSIINLCTVALLGLLLRSKILFALPAINYTHLLDSHSHFAFGGWITLALVVLMVSRLLPPGQGQKKIYQWIYLSLSISSWIMLLTYYLEANSTLSALVSGLFIMSTYLLAWVFIRDIRSIGLDRTISLLAIAALACLVLSSAGPLTLDYLFATRSTNAIVYRDALFTYLHLQYNGFFTLSVFSLFFHRIQPMLPFAGRRAIRRFSVALVISIIPSLFLSYLWHDPHGIFRIIAVSGSFLVLLSLTLFILSSKRLLQAVGGFESIVRFILYLSFGAFVLKSFLQGFTIFPALGNAVFGNRPMIIGFLHLVFLGFTSLFILAYYAQEQVLDTKSRFSRIALILFSLGVVFNEGVLLSQGLGAMFLQSSVFTPWFLWIISICMCAGALMIGYAVFSHKTNTNSPSA